MRAQQQVQGVIEEAERELMATRGVAEERAQRWVSDSVRPLQQQIQIGNQQLAEGDNQLMDREVRIARLHAHWMHFRDMMPLRFLFHPGLQFLNHP